MSGLIDQPQEWAPWMNHSNSPDAINYTRPGEGAFMSTTPTSMPDASAVDDSNEGWLGDAWKSVKQFVGLEPEEDKEKERKKDEENDKTLKEISETIKKDEEKSKEEKPKKVEISNKAMNLAYQAFFSQTHPLIGQPYSGPQDGKMNPQLQAAAKSAEAKIGAAIGGSVDGMILSGENFATDPSDVIGAINVIMKHKKTDDEEKSSLASIYLDIIK